MRLFLAILPDDSLRQTLLNIQNDMKKQGIRGRYTDPFNLHMTLLFIGEYGDPGRVNDLLEDIPFAPFEIRLSGIVRMRDLYLCTLQESREAETLARRLRRTLAGHDIPFDRKTFFPHITLLRKAENDPLQSIPEPVGTMEVSCISLMKSERGTHGMVYTEIGSICENIILPEDCPPGYFPE